MKESTKATQQSAMQHPSWLSTNVQPQFQMSLQHIHFTSNAGSRSSTVFIQQKMQNHLFATVSHHE